MRLRKLGVCLLFVSLPFICGAERLSYVIGFVSADDGLPIDEVTVLNLMNDDEVTVIGGESVELSDDEGTSGENPLFDMPGEQMKVSVHRQGADFRLEVLTLDGGPLSVRMYAADGRMVASFDDDAASIGGNAYAVSAPAAGVYLLECRSAKRSASVRFVSESGGASSIRRMGRVEYATRSVDSMRESARVEEEAVIGGRLKFEEGDVIRITARSGEMVTVMTEAPERSAEYQIRFIDCRDASGTPYPMVKIGGQYWTQTLISDFEAGVVGRPQEMFLNTLEAYVKASSLSDRLAGSEEAGMTYRVLEKFGLEIYDDGQTGVKERLTADYALALPGVEDVARLYSLLTGGRSISDAKPTNGEKLPFLASYIEQVNDGIAGALPNSTGDGEYSMVVGYPCAVNYKDVDGEYKRELVCSAFEWIYPEKYGPVLRLKPIVKFRDTSVANTLGLGTIFCNYVDDPETELRFKFSFPDIKVGDFKFHYYWVDWAVFDEFVSKAEAVQWQKAYCEMFISQVAASDVDCDGNDEIFVTFNDLIYRVAFRDGEWKTEKKIRIPRDAEYFSGVNPADVIYFMQPLFYDLDGDGRKDLLFCVNANQADTEKGISYLLYYKNADLDAEPERFELFRQKKEEIGAPGEYFHVDDIMDFIRCFAYAKIAAVGHKAEIPKLYVATPYSRNIGSELTEIDSEYYWRHSKPAMYIRVFDLSLDALRAGTFTQFEYGVESYKNAKLSYARTYTLAAPPVMKTAFLDGADKPATIYCGASFIVNDGHRWNEAVPSDYFYGTFLDGFLGAAAGRWDECPNDGNDVFLVSGYSTSKGWYDLLYTSSADVLSGKASGIYEIGRDVRPETLQIPLLESLTAPTVLTFNHYVMRLSEPVIQALLAAPVYYEKYGVPAGVTVGTAWGYSKSQGSGSESGNTLSYGGAVGGGLSVPVFDILGLGMDVQATFDRGKTDGISNTKVEEEVAVYRTATNPAVVFSALPFDMYVYKIQSTPSGEHGGELMISLPHGNKSITAIWELDEYNEAVASISQGVAYINPEILHHKAGQPDSYLTWDGVDKEAAKKALGAYTGENGFFLCSSPYSIGRGAVSTEIELSLSESEETYEGGSWSRGFDVAATLFFVKGSGYGSWGDSWQTTTTHGSSSMVQGWIPGLPVNAPQYYSKNVNLVWYKYQMETGKKGEDGNPETVLFDVVNYLIEE